MDITSDFTIKRHDAGRIISGHFLEADGSQPDLSGPTTPKLFMRNQATGELKINGAAFTFTNAAVAAWSYQFTADDVDTSGVYQLEFQVGRPGGRKDTFPTDQAKPYMIVLIQEDLGE